MTRKRTNGRKKNKSLFPGAAAMENCVFSQSVMFNIVTRLPVKSIHRFKAVCKPWNKLFSSPKFMKAHHTQLSQNPEDQFVMVYCFTEKNGNTLSLYKIGHKKGKPVILDNPFPRWLYPMDFVGVCNGLICWYYPPMGSMIELYNPAFKKSKPLPTPNLNSAIPAMVSIGFGYDNESDDFRVVRIVSEVKERKGMKIKVGVEVYSANSDSWRTICVGFQFSVLETRNDAIVNGNNLYWVAKVDDDDDDDDDDNGVLLQFDVSTMKFKVVPLSTLNLEEEQVAFVDWKGAIAALVCNNNDGTVLSLDVWVFEDGRDTWTKNHSFGPIELKVDRFLRCLKGGEIIGECPDGKLFVLDENYGGRGGVKKKIVIDEAHKRSFEIYEYTESLACVKGMKNLVPETEFGDERKFSELFCFMMDLANRADRPHEITIEI